MKMYYVAEVLDWFENISLCWNDVTFTSHDGNTYTYTWLDAANEIWALARMKRWVNDDVTFGEVLNRLGIE